MGHRIREVMREGDLAPFGSNGGTVEVDETFIGQEDGIPKRRGYAHKRKILSLVDRESGEARSMVIDSLKAASIIPILKENIAHEARVMTDDAGQYKYLNEHFAEHGCTGIVKANMFPLPILPSTLTPWKDFSLSSNVA